MPSDFIGGDSGAGRLDIDKRRCLGDLDDQALGRTRGSAHSLAQPIRPIRVMQRCSGNIHGKTGARVLMQPRERQIQDAAVEQSHQTGLLGDGEQAGRSHHRTVGQDKTEQRFLERNRFRGDAHHRLQRQADAVLVER